jgi:DNA-binding transcriptional MerR regulator
VGTASRPLRGYSVKAACQRLGIGPHTLRAWEARYGAVAPERTGTGRRRYTEAQLERLSRIVALVNHGHAVGTVAGLSDAELAELLRASERRSPFASSHTLLKAFLDTLHAALEHFDVHQVSSLLDRQRCALGARRFVLEVLPPLLRWLGTKVEAKELSIAHEHALSAVLRDQLYQALRYGAAPVFTTNSSRFILATAEDDLHELGILMAAALLSHHALPSHFLGANLPVEALAIAVKAIRGDIVVLGNAPVPDDERKVPFDRYLAEAHRLLPKSVAVWIGGAGPVPHLRRVMPGRKCRVLTSLEQFDELIAGFAAEGGS